jgi:hypothetical protein
MIGYCCKSEIGGIENNIGDVGVMLVNETRWFWSED